jgi:hypothetical protein
MDLLRDADGKPVWRRVQAINGVTQELWELNPERPILFMPGAGQITSKGATVSSTGRAKVRGNESEGWQILEGNDNWEACSADYARELFEKGGAELVAQELL